MSTGKTIKQQQEHASEFLPYDLPYMTDELKKRAKAELFEDEETREHKLKLLKAMLNEKWEPNIHSMSDIMRMLTTGITHAIRSPSTQVAGIKVIVNFKGLTLAKMSHITPRYLLLFAEALQNSFPARFRGVHIVNHDYLFIPIWSVLKMFLNKKIRNRMHLHGANLAKFHSFFSTKILPEELGGELQPYDNTDWARSMEQTAAEITEIFSGVY